jgi:hypothetical protein
MEEHRVVAFLRCILQTISLRIVLYEEPKVWGSNLVYLTSDLGCLCMVFVSVLELC